MVHISLYIEDDLAAKLDKHQQVKRNKNTSQVIREILYDFFDKLADISASNDAGKDLDAISQEKAQEE